MIQPTPPDHPPGGQKAPVYWALVAGAVALLMGAGVALLLVMDEAPSPRPAVDDPGGPSPNLDRPSVDLLRGAEVVADALSPTESLRLRYTVPPGSDVKHLVVVGRDGAGAIHWWLPAGGPGAPGLTVSEGPEPQAVAEVGAPRPALGPLDLCAVFTQRPVDTAALHRTLSAGAWPPPGGVQHCQRLSVEP